MTINDNMYRKGALKTVKYSADAKGATVKLLEAVQGAKLFMTAPSERVGGGGERMSDGG